MPEIFSTPPDKAVISVYGTYRLPSGTYVTKLPLLDARTLVGEPDWHYGALCARLGYDAAREAAKRHGGRLIRPQTVIELNRVGFRIEPVILPAGPQMSSLDYCRRHDDNCWSQLARMEWDGTLPVMNFGKWNVLVDDMDTNHDGDDSENDWTHLFGWSKRRDACGLGANDFHDWYQPLYRHCHKGRQQRDYGTLTMLEWDE